MRAARRLLPLLALLSLAACYDFERDLALCGEAGHPCASGVSGEPDAGSPDEPDAGGDDPTTVRAEQCTSDSECQSGHCEQGCCDAACAAVVQVVGGGGFTCARLDTGRVRCWGKNDVGQLGLGYVSPQPEGSLDFVPIPTDVPGLADVRELGAGADFACARLGDGTVRCWGNNASGQLGRGPTAPARDATPAPVLGLVTAQGLELGYHHACARLGDGTVRCWGDGEHGQLGDGSLASSAVPVAVCSSGTGATCLAFANVTALALGSLHSCAQKQDGSVWCWGDNARLQLGPNGPTDTNALRPLRVPLPVGTPTALVAGSDTVCAVLGGQAQCWGYDLSPGSATGLLGRGPLPVEASAQAAPVCSAVSPEGVCTLLEDVREAAFSLHAGCARAGSAVYCWGSDVHLGLARETSPASGASNVAQRADAPTPLAGKPLLTDGVTAVAAGLEHFCALRAGGLVCWGRNVSGELGTNDSRVWNADTVPQRPIW